MRFELEFSVPEGQDCESPEEQVSEIAGRLELMCVRAQMWAEQWTEFAQVGDRGSVMDANGNAIGTWRITAEQVVRG